MDVAYTQSDSAGNLCVAAWGYFVLAADTLR